ncbi:MAG TPA: FHA domain-containing protein [Kofleriaceae bacterium]|nr:FHA domain-containing protein [Kofleriaceae bacterium]
MGTLALIVLVGGIAAVIAAASVLVSRAAGGGGGKRHCGSCRRVMMPAWDKCLFCGWVPSAAAPGGAPAGAQAPASSGPPRIEFVCGSLRGQVVTLAAQLTTVGSVEGNTVICQDQGVSRKHLAIRRVGSGYEVADLGSTNGVYVNGHREAKKLLAAGDIVRLGQTEIVFHG